jgi:hypothetical protein
MFASSVTALKRLRRNGLLTERFEGKFLLRYTRY